MSASYHLLVDDLLVRVGKEGSPVSPAQPPDETRLVVVLNDELTVRPPRLWPYNANTYDIPKSEVIEISKGNQQVMIDLIKKYKLNWQTKVGKLRVDHLLALGGFSESIMRLQKFNYRTSDSNMASIGSMAAIIGHMNVIDILEKSPYTRYYLPESITKATFFNQTTYLAALRKLSYLMDGKTPPVCIPSLRSICAAVVASETTRHPHSYTTLLANTPLTVFELVCEKIAGDSEFGFKTFELLKKENPIFHERIPFGAWVDAMQANESRARHINMEYDFLLDQDPYPPLIDVFAEVDRFVIKPIEDYDSESTGGRFFTQSREVGAPSITNSRDQFLRQLTTFTSDFFEDFDFSNVAVIGGTVAGSLLPLPHPSTLRLHHLQQQLQQQEEDEKADEEVRYDEEGEGAEGEGEEGEGEEGKAEESKGEGGEGGEGQWTWEPRRPRGSAPRRERVPNGSSGSTNVVEEDREVTPGEYYNTYSHFKGSDIDLYIYGLDVEAFTAKVGAICTHVKAYQKRVAPDREVLIMRSRCSVSFHLHYPFRTIQIVLGQYASLWEILTGVDIDCTAVAYDGTKLWATPRAKLAWNHRWTITDPELYSIRGCPQYECRLVKYARRGFTIVDRNYPQHAHKYPKTQEDLDSEYNYDFYRGIELISYADRSKKVLKNLMKRASSTQSPYGPGIGATVVLDFFEQLGNSTDEGYGPSDTVPQECSEGNLANVRHMETAWEAMKEDFGVESTWYPQSY